MIRDYDETQYLTKRYKRLYTDEAKEKRVRGLRRMLPRFKLSKSCKQCETVFHRTDESYAIWRGKKCCSEDCRQKLYRQRVNKEIQARALKKKPNPKAKEVTDIWLYGKTA